MMRALVLLFFAARAFALDTALIHKVAVYDKPKRKILEGDSLKRFAATGVIRCGGRQASAQVTGAKNIVTTSDHIFFSQDTCEAKSKPEDCTLTLRTAKGTRKYAVAAKIGGGFKCPGKNMPWGDDWAVLRLQEDVEGVEPYKIPMMGDVLHKEDEEVVAVAGASRDFFKVLNDGSKYYPPTHQKCSVKFIRDVSGGGSYVETDCDNAELGSGGSLLRPSGDSDTLIGVYMGSFEFTPMLEKALEEKRVNIGPYEQGRWAAIYTSVDGLFLKTLTQAVGRDI